MSLQADKWPKNRAAKGKITGRLAFALLSFLLLGLLGCASEQKVNPHELNIPILGDAAWLKADGSFLNGVELAQEELNKEYSVKGYTIKTQVIDDMGTYDKGVEMAARLGSDKTVTAVVNLQDFAVSKTTAGMLSEDGKLVFFPYGVLDSLMDKGNKMLFCNVPSFVDLGTAMANYAVQKGYKRIAVYHNGDESQDELASAFELALSHSDAKIVDYVPKISSHSDFDTVYSRWKALDVDCVVIAQYGSDKAYELLRMIRNRDKKLAVLGEPVFNAADLLSQNKEIAENLVIPSPLMIKESKKLEQFKEQYRHKFNKEADIWAVQGYDTVRLIADTYVKTGSSDPELLLKALHNPKGYNGLAGNIAFSDGGALIVNVKDINMLIAKDGKFEEIKN